MAQTAPEPRFDWAASTPVQLCVVLAAILTQDGKTTAIEPNRYFV
jgi:hypothetical protein